MTARTRGRAARACALALPLLAGGCFIFAPPQPMPTPEEGAWAAARDHFTASAKLYDGLTMRAFVAATYQAPAVREQRVQRVALWRNLPAAERDLLLAAERDDAQRHDEFLVSLFTPGRPDNDLDSPRSIWRLTVVAPGGVELPPERVEGVKPDATLRKLYPAIGDFDQVYRVVFPRPGGPPLAGQEFKFRMSSALGRIDLGFPSKER